MRKCVNKPLLDEIGGTEFLKKLKKRTFLCLNITLLKTMVILRLINIFRH